MFEVFNQRSQILIEAQKAKFKPGFLIQVLIFIAIFIITNVVQAIPLTIYGIVWGVIKGLKGELPFDDQQALAEVVSRFEANLILPTLFAFGIITLLVIVYCRFIEKRSLYSMGFVREKAFADYLMGLLIGFIMFAAAVLLAFISGTVKYNGFVLESGFILLLGFFIGFIIQGMAEEVLVRGYFMVSVANRNSILLAVFSNSIIFALLHIFNYGISALGIINLILFGIFTSIYMLKMNSIWGICAIHSMWNFAQGNIFGISVSGMKSQVSIFSFKLTSNAELINGGAFGLEGGLAVTVVLVLSTILVMRMKGRGIVEESSDYLNETR
ncbi:MAG: CPBP family intramembrane metalloprotease [Clostridiaceae bacterium]|nr:CPBP family intramembrane metalloprotease [Clostridiaceae bacterium]